MYCCLFSNVALAHLKTNYDLKFTLEQTTKAQRGCRGVTLSLISTLDGCELSTPGPRRFTSEKKPGTHSTGGWVGPRAALDMCEKYRPHRDPIPGPSGP
jgi:hypothetical protein